MDDAPLNFPRPAWCPECGGDYDGDSAICPKCGYDAGGEVVLIDSDVLSSDPRRLRNRRQTSATLLVLCLVLSAIGGWVCWRGGWPDKSNGFLIVTTGVATVFWVGYAVDLWWLRDAGTAGGLPRRRLQHLRLSRRGHSLRTGPGPVQWQPWKIDATPVVSSKPDGLVSVAVRNGLSDEFSPFGGHGQTFNGSGMTAGQIRDHIAVLIRASAAEHARVPPTPHADVATVSHCPKCGYEIGRPAPERCAECGWQGEAGEIVLYGHGTVSPTLLPLLRMIGVLTAFTLAAWFVLPAISIQIKLSPFVSMVVLGLIVVGFLGFFVVGIAHAVTTTEAQKRDAVAESARRPPGDVQLRATSNGFSLRYGLGEPKWRPWSIVRRMEVEMTRGAAILKFRLHSWNPWKQMRFSFIAGPAALTDLSRRLEAWKLTVEDRTRPER